MTLQTIEPVLYLPDDTPFFAEPGDVRHGLRLLWRAFGFLGLCLIVYFPVFIWGGLVWQDEMRVTQNVLLWSWSGLAGVWAHAVGGVYHPISQSLVLLQHHFFGPNPRGYHLVSIAMHAINAGLLWMVLRRLGVRGAWLGAALFAVHPVEVQSVAWISQQSHLVGAGFFLGAVWAYLRLSRIVPPPQEEFGQVLDVYDWDDLLAYEPVAKLYALAMGLAVVATLSDPVAMALPIVLLMLVWWKRGKVGGADWLKLAPFFLLAVLGWVVNAQMVSRGGSLDAGAVGPLLSVSQRLLVDCRACWTYAANVLWPYPLLFVYARWNVGQAWQLLFPAGLVLLIASTWAGKKWMGRGPLAVVLVFAALLLPAFISVAGAANPPIYVADHWEYLASGVPIAAFASALVAAVSWFSSATLVRSLRVVAAAICLGGLAFLSIQQGRIYDREESVWQDALFHQPGSRVAVGEYVQLLLRQHRDNEAANLVHNAEESGPTDVSFLLSQAKIYNSEARYSDVIRCYLDASKLDPGNDQILLGLAEAYVRDGQPEQAMQIYDNRLKKHPNDAATLNNMGLALMAQGKVDEAIARYEQAIKFNPRFVPAYVNCSNAYIARHQLEPAAKLLQQAVALDPRNYPAFYNAGVTLFNGRDFANAEQMFRAATRVQPDSAEAWDRLGTAQAAQGKDRYSEAVWNFDHAVRLKPDFEEARRHLEKARADLAASRK